ncbi:MAG: T9SS type A sorting domain-containing protein [Salinivirgaceae bacterium]
MQRRDVFKIKKYQTRLKCLIFALVWVVLTNLSLSAQESITPISENSQLFNKPIPSPQKNGINSLPFFDDFSNNSIFPSADNWQNTHVFVNNSYGQNPPSVGVATFDAINNLGYLYTTLSEIPSQADTLTSRYINLSGVNPDSLFLSFYYQPQGFGDQPEPDDSLILQFITPDTIVTVWAANGISFNDFLKDTLKLGANPIDTLLFKLVHLKIKNPIFLKDNFQFRFINYASFGWNNATSINCDQWNIDYVYLNKGRTVADTIFKDVSMVEPPGSFLKNFSSIPWAHFESAIDLELKNLYVHVRNNDKTSRNLTQIRFDLSDSQTQWVDSFAIGDIDLEAFTNRSDLNYQFDSSRFVSSDNEEAHFKIKAQLSTDGYDFSKPNNAAYRTVDCVNYYAYDDGTAEYAYNLEGNDHLAAYYYKIYQPDSLRAFSLYFLRNKEQEAALNSFILCVWQSKNGVPGELIYKEDVAKNVIFENGLNQFITIKLDSSIYLEGDFFIGWDQQDGLSINIGFDSNTNTSKKRFYKHGQEWVMGDADKSGSLMLRPIFGKPVFGTSVHKELASKASLMVFPNPSEGKFTIQNTEQFQSGMLRIYNNLGSMVGQTELNTTSFDFTKLKPGIYIISIQSENLAPQAIKWIKN